MSAWKPYWGQILVFALLLLSGCDGSLSSKQATPELPSWLTDEDSSTGTSEAEAILSQDGPTNLSLNLKPGDRFPLRKVVEQELTQDVNGVPQLSRSRLELMLAISVVDKQGDRTKLAVVYERVKYRHDVAEEHIEFDSAQATGQVPVAVRAYRDMVNDGFAFWIGADNQIVGVEGLTEFLNRCLRDVPFEQRQEVVLGMEAGSGETGIANFVDHSIGLLPYGTQPQLGESWERQQHISRPVPLHVSNQYTLKEVNNSIAVIDIRGNITPSTTLNAISNNGVQVTVMGGNTLGSCTIFRDTGLPKESRVDRVIDMVVQTHNTEFRQRKRVTTTIESFPQTMQEQPLTIGWQTPPGSMATQTQ